MLPIFRFWLAQNPNHREVQIMSLCHSKIFQYHRSKKLLTNLCRISGLLTPLMVTLDLVSDPFLICVVIFTTVIFLHVKCATKLEWRLELIGALPRQWMLSNVMFNCSPATNPFLSFSNIRFASQTLIWIRFLLVHDFLPSYLSTCVVPK